MFSLNLESGLSLLRVAPVEMLGSNPIQTSRSCIGLVPTPGETRGGPPQGHNLLTTQLRKLISLSFTDLDLGTSFCLGTIQSE